MCRLTNYLKQKTIEEIIAEKSVGMTDRELSQYWWELSQNIFALLGKVEVPIIPLSNDIWKQTALTQYPTLASINFADSEMYSTTLDSLQAILSRDYTNVIQYISDTMDCVTGNTTVWIRDQNGINLVEVRELIPFTFGTEIFTRDGFVPLTGVQLKGTRPTMRLVDSTDIGITSNHKIVANPSLIDGKYISVENASREHLIKCLPDIPDNDEGDYELGWALGAFCAEGTTVTPKGKGDTHTWSIRQTNVSNLERAQATLDMNFPEMKFYIKSYPSEGAGVQTNLGTRRGQIYHLLASPRERHNDDTKNKFVKYWRRLFYNSYKIKRVPMPVICGSVSQAQGFWDSMIVHDNSHQGVISASNLETAGLSTILRKLGKEPSICMDKEFAVIYPKSDGHFWGKNWVNGRTKTKKWKFPSGEKLVYDITTQNGEFVAGDIAVKNCDKYANELYSHLCKFYGINAVVPVWGDTTKAYHGFNLAVIMDGDTWIARLIEPQKDDIFIEFGPLGQYIPRRVSEELGVIKP